jgi:hypothetical protein
MFVRFRKVPNGGFQPQHTADGVAQLQCAAPYGRVCRESCHRHPRCRWAIQVPGSSPLEPYRLKVLLIENTRINGKVKQSLVATLGSIDATLLDYFYGEIAPEIAAGLRCADWRHRSLTERQAFWNGVLERMGAIGDNRLSADDRKAIRRAIHRVIPWVMEEEKKELTLLDAKRDCRSIKRMRENWEERAERHEETIQRYEEWIKRETEQLNGAKTASAKMAELAFKAGAHVAKLSK